jgi:hypothetical protein
LFTDLWSNDDTLKNGIAASVIEGEYPVLAEGVLALGLSPEDFEARLFSTHGRAEGVDQRQPILTHSV